MNAFGKRFLALALSLAFTAAILELGLRLWRATVPAADRADLFCLVLRLPPTGVAAPAAPAARLAGAGLERLPAGRAPRHPLFVTERLPGAPKPRRLVVETPPWMSARHGELEIAMYRWRAPDRLETVEP